MSAPPRIALFGVVLLAAFGAATLAGAALDPTTERPASRHAAAGAHGNEHGAGHGAMAHGDTALSGLAVAENGLRLQLDDPIRAAGSDAPLRLRILGRDGRALRSGFQVEHAKRLHLIVVRRDTGVFRHLHPTLGADGTWQTTGRLDEPGAYRVFADFQVGGAKRVLATDLAVDGDAVVRPLPAPRPTAAARDADDTPSGYDVARRSGTVRAGQAATLRFAVSHDTGRGVVLEPYLGARGHLVALREGDLGYLHVHPLEAAAGGDEVAFAATFPTPGRYRLFLQVRVDGAVRTAAFSVDVAR